MLFYVRRSANIEFWSVRRCVEWLDIDDPNFFRPRKSTLRISAGCDGRSLSWPNWPRHLTAKTISRDCLVPFAISSSGNAPLQLSTIRFSAFTIPIVHRPITRDFRFSSTPMAHFLSNPSTLSMLLNHHPPPPPPPLDRNRLS